MRSCLETWCSLSGSRVMSLGDLTYYASWRTSGGEAFSWKDTVPRVDPTVFLARLPGPPYGDPGRLVASCTSVGMGGLALALCRTAMGGDLGMEIDLNSILVNQEDTIRPDRILLFPPSQGRILLTTAAPENIQRVISCFKDLPCARIGRVQSLKTACNTRNQREGNM